MLDQIYNVCTILMSKHVTAGQSGKECVEQMQREKPVIEERRCGSGPGLALAVQARRRRTKGTPHAPFKFEI